MAPPTTRLSFTARWSHALSILPASKYLSGFLVELQGLGPNISRKYVEFPEHSCRLFPICISNLLSTCIDLNLEYPKQNIY